MTEQVCAGANRDFSSILRWWPSSLGPWQVFFGIPVNSIPVLWPEIEKNTGKALKN
jgi:hypothetical protein